MKKAEVKQFAVNARQRAMLEWRAFAEDESGLGVIEVVLILVVIIGLIAIFKKEINALLNSIFTKIEEMSEDIY